MGARAQDRAHRGGRWIESGDSTIGQCVDIPAPCHDGLVETLPLIIPSSPDDLAAATLVAKLPRLPRLSTNSIASRWQLNRVRIQTSRSRRLYRRILVEEQPRTTHRHTRQRRARRDEGETTRTSIGSKLKVGHKLRLTQDHAACYFYAANQYASAVVDRVNAKYMPAREPNPATAKMLECLDDAVAKLSQDAG
jgi:hypothetical protein